MMLNKVMITESELYWITRLDAFHDIIVLTVIVLVILFITNSIVGGNIISENEKLSRKLFFYGLFFFLFALILIFGKAFLPTTKEMAAIKAVPLIANSEIVSKDAKHYIRRLLEATLEKIEKKGEK